MPKGSWKEFDQDQIKPKDDRLAEGLISTNSTQVRVQKTKAGRGGKIVTLISGLDLLSLEARALLKNLKASCGTGGTIKNDVLELQGDHVKETMDILSKEGFIPKKSGG